MNTCLDEGTLQAYLDGELSPDTLNGVAAHLAACAFCAEAARAAESELALFSTAFAPALPVSVPTQKLRERLDNAIAELNATVRPFAAPTTPRLRSFFESLIASLTTFTPRQATAFASFLVAAVALAVVFFALSGSPEQPNTPQPNVRNIQTPTPSASVASAGGSQTQNDQGAIQTQGDKVVADVAPIRVDRRKATASVRFIAAGYTREARNPKTDNENATVAAASEPVLADEKTYLSSIASLTSAIESQGAQAMSPTLRAEYERNLAVVNQAINASRVAAQSNPQDADAKEFLRAAYQNKVELLSAVADQTQIASNRD